MLVDFSLVQGEYLQDILHQPEALERTVETLGESKPLLDLKQRLHAGQFKVVVLTGMGASYHALHPLHLGLTDHGFTSVMVETSELIHHQTRLLDSRNLLVAVSQSGRSAEIIRLLERNGRACPVVAVTNTPDSPLAQAADATILTQAGKEFSVSCKTYVAALMALAWLEQTLCHGDLRQARDELRQAISSVANYLANWKKYTESFYILLAGIRHLFLVGRGRSLAAVGTGALIVKESDHFHAEGMSSAAFRHGPFEMLSNEVFVLVFGGDTRTRNLNRSLLQDVRDRGGRGELVADDAKYRACALPAVPEAVLPIVEILPVQMITLALAAQEGRRPGSFQLASKVTTTE